VGNAASDGNLSPAHAQMSAVGGIKHKSFLICLLQRATGRWMPSISANRG
jgi:hypothetical protein